MGRSGAGPGGVRGCARDRARRVRAHLPRRRRAPGCRSGRCRAHRQLSGVLVLLGRHRPVRAPRRRPSRHRADRRAPRRWRRSASRWCATARMPARSSMRSSPPIPMRNRRTTSTRPSTRRRSDRGGATGPLQGVRLHRTASTGAAFTSTCYLHQCRRLHRAAFTGPPSPVPPTERRPQRDRRRPRVLRGVVSTSVHMRTQLLTVRGLAAMKTGQYTLGDPGSRAESGVRSQESVAAGPIPNCVRRTIGRPLVGRRARVGETPERTQNDLAAAVGGGAACHGHKSLRRTFPRALVGSAPSPTAPAERSSVRETILRAVHHPQERSAGAVGVGVGIAGAVGVGVRYCGRCRRGEPLP